MARYAFYTSSKRTWTAMLSELERAEHSIFIEMYIMVDDTEGFEFIGMLERKAREGITVKLVLDSFGSFSLSNEAIERLRAAGVEILFFSRWLHRLHRKIVIVDERVVITGGVNIHLGAAGWTDLALRVTGGFVPRTALNLFAATYFRIGGTDPALRKFLRGDVSGRQKVTFFSFRPSKKLKRLYVKKLFEAKRSIKLVTPYFVPDRWLLGALDTALLRGVSVDIVIPDTTDSWFMDRANYFYISKMGRANLRFFLFPKMNHAKVLIIDAAEVLIGSQNLDALSFNYNLESGVLMTDPEAVENVCQIVEGWEGESHVLRTDSYKRRWYDTILAPVIRLFQPFL